MTDDRDPTLQALFNDAQEDLQDPSFTQLVMGRIEQAKRRRARTWIGFDLILVLCAWLLAEPLQTTVYAVMPILTGALIQRDNQLLAELLHPINNLAAILALGFFVLRSVYRRLFS